MAEKARIERIPCLDGVSPYVIDSMFLPSPSLEEYERERVCCRNCRSAGMIVRCAHRPEFYRPYRSPEQQREIDETARRIMGDDPKK
jgi:hypothetical protein